MRDSSAPQYRAALRAWFATPPGRELAAAEAGRLRAMLPAAYLPAAAQIGGVHLDGVMAAVNTGVRAVVGPLAGTVTAGPEMVTADAKTAAAEAETAPPTLLTVHAKPEHTPLGGNSIDLALLPHTLDLCADPHAVLRETAQVVAPDGYIAVAGFNPHGLWAWLNWLRPGSPHPPRRGRHHPLTVVQDWLALLGFESVAGEMVFYRPPFTDARRPRWRRWHERLAFLERAGPRWWPFAAAAYVLLARKKTLRLAGVAERARAAPGLAVAPSPVAAAASLQAPNS